MSDRPNIAVLQGGLYNIVGGLGNSGYAHYNGTELGREIKAELIDSKPIFAHETTYFRFRVLGMGMELLVPIENVREYVAVR